MKRIKKKNRKFSNFLLVLFLLFSFAVFGLEEDTSNKEDKTTIVKVEKDKADKKPAIKEEDKASVNPTAVTLANIPAYSTNAYIAINDNVPQFSDSQKQIRASFETYSDLDSLGRTQVALACLSKDTMPKANDKRGSISKVKPTGWKQAQYDSISGKYLYNRCHLIGWQLSDEDANERNLITGTKYINIEGMLPFENMVADYIKETKNHVLYRVTPIYEGNNLLCSGVQIEAYSLEDQGAGISFNVYCYNVQPNVNINYADGSSSAVVQQVEAPAPNNNTNQTNSTSSNNVSNGAYEDATETVNTGVYITATGSKYHNKPNCGTTKYAKEVTLDEAKSQGYEACKRCY